VPRGGERWAATGSAGRQAQVENFSIGGVAVRWCSNGLSTAVVEGILSTTTPFVAVMTARPAAILVGAVWNYAATALATWKQR
jgi:hypothetical protein